MQASEVETTRKILEHALPRVTAPLSAMGIGDRDRMIREFDRRVGEGIDALAEIAELRVPVDFAELEDEAGAENARSLLDQARRLNEVVSEATAALRGQSSPARPTAAW